MAARKGQNKVGGRTKGTPNKITHDIRMAARGYTTEALERLATLMRSDDYPAVARAACSELLAYGWGRPQQSVEVNSNQHKTVVIRWQASEGSAYRREILLKRLEEPVKPVEH